MVEAATVYVALGSNQGDRRTRLQEAVHLLDGCMQVARLSGVYETEPAYVTDQPPYLNMVLMGSTTLAPRALLHCLKRIEQEMGRRGGRRWGPRPIDLDILLYADRLVRDAELEIPHPRLHERPFVLQPLAELAPDLTPPGLAAPIRDLLRAAPPVGSIIARIGPLYDP